MTKGIRSATERIRVFAGVVISENVVSDSAVIGFDHVSQMPPSAKDSMSKVTK